MNLTKMPCILLAVRRDPPGVLRGFLNRHRTARAVPLLKSGLNPTLDARKSGRRGEGHRLQSESLPRAQFRAFLPQLKRSE